MGYLREPAERSKYVCTWSEATKKGAVMINESKRGPMTSLTVWAGQDGLVPLGGELVGVEFRGRVGHPSSYGVLIGKSSSDGPGVQIDSALRGELLKVASVGGDRTLDGMSEPEYGTTIRASAEELGLCIVATLAGEMSSSRVVFSRLAVVLSGVLGSPNQMPSSTQMWDLWDSVK